MCDGDERSEPQQTGFRSLAFLSVLPAFAFACLTSLDWVSACARSFLTLTHSPWRLAVVLLQPKYQ